MVTKLISVDLIRNQCSVLAKIHMVTKQLKGEKINMESSVLAKIHMVTKPSHLCQATCKCSVLAKIHMVTKPMFCPSRSPFLFCSSKNSYGNKTINHTILLNT